jgi:hypothetical protein
LEGVWGQGGSRVGAPCTEKRFVGLAIKDFIRKDLVMVKDRYGTSPFSTDSICVFDTSLKYDTELFEDTVGFKLKNVDTNRYSSAYEIDVGAGADWPVVIYEVLEKFVPFSAVAAAFFLGEKIEKSALAWKRITTSLLNCIPKGGFTDANGAALFALERVFEKLNPKSVVLIAYTWVDEEIVFFDETNKASAAFDLILELDRISEREDQFGEGLHSTPTFLFKFKADDKVVLVKVHGRSVTQMII